MIEGHIWGWINNSASIITIISAVVTLVSSISIRKYYKKVVKQYSTEKIVIAEQKAHEAKQIYQKIKGMYIEQRGFKKEAFSKSYLELENCLDEVSYYIPSVNEDAINLVKETKAVLNDIYNEQELNETNNKFVRLSALLDNISSALKSVKEQLHEDNIKR